MADPSIHVLLDQNVPREIVQWLRARRTAWRISHVAEIGLSRALDTEIFAWAQEHQAIVVTFDEDFADRRMFPVGTHCGVIRLHVWPTTTEEVQRGLGRLLEEVPDADLVGSLVIVERHRIRIRRRPSKGS